MASPRPSISMRYEHGYTWTYTDSVPMLDLVETRTDVATQRELGERLDRARERSGLSQAEPAESVGLT